VVNSTVDETHRLSARLAIWSAADIEIDYSDVKKYSRGKRERHAVLRQIARRLGVVPFKCGRRKHLR
jgi:hypothetical protein